MGIAQIIRENNPHTQKHRDSLLRCAWLAVPDPLHSRPDPRRPWDAAARSDCPYDPWSRTIEPLRSALRAAVKTRNPQIVKAVAIRIEAFFEVMKADVLSVSPLLEEANILRAAIEETETQGPADVAMAEVISDPMPCPAKLEKAERTLSHHRNAIDRCLSLVGALLRNGIRPQLSVTR